MSMYAVNTLKTDITIDVMGLERPMELNWADGMVGAIPVFEDKESALSYAGGNESLLTEVSEVLP